MLMCSSIDINKEMRGCSFRLLHIFFLCVSFINRSGFSGGRIMLKEFCEDRAMLCSPEWLFPVSITFSTAVLTNIRIMFELR